MVYTLLSFLLKDRRELREVKSEKARPQLLPGQFSDSALFGFRESREKKETNMQEICSGFDSNWFRLSIQKFPLAELNTALWFSVCSPSLPLWFWEKEAEHRLRSRLYFSRFYCLCFFP